MDTRTIEIIADEAVAAFVKGEKPFCCCNGSGKFWNAGAFMNCPACHPDKMGWPIPKTQEEPQP